MVTFELAKNAGHKRLAKILLHANAYFSLQKFALQDSLRFIVQRQQTPGIAHNYLAILRQRQVAASLLHQSGAALLLQLFQLSAHRRG